MRAATIFSKMIIILHHVKNVDLMHGQGNGTGYWEPAIDKRRIVQEVSSLAEASAALTQWVARNGLGGGNLARDCGEVRDNGKVIARVSYNGRVWEPGEWPTKEIVLSPATDHASR
jgi:hypothetical protein